MKKIKIFMMMLLAVLSFAACSDDDDPNENVISEYTHNDQIVAAQKAKSGKNEAVLLVAFGSTWTNAFAAFDETKKAYEQAFPNADVYFCFSSDICINRASAGEHGEKRDYYEPRYLLHAIGAAKYSKVYVQSLQVIPGEEFANVVAAVKKFANNGYVKDAHLDDEYLKNVEIHLGMPLLNDIDEVDDVIKKTAFKITRMGQLVGTEASKMLGVPFGIVDLSLAPTPAVGDSVAHILEEIGLESCGAYGTTAALAMLNDAVKKGGVMASSHVGGLSGAFIPVSEDAGMIDAARCGSLCIEKLEAMTAVCSVGLDMIVVPGDTPADVISAMIADEAAIGMVNSKTTAVRVIPAIGMKEGEELEFGGLFGSGPVMKINKFSPSKFISRGGRIPAPLQSLKN